MTRAALAGGAAAKGGRVPQGHPTPREPCPCHRTCTRGCTPPWYPSLLACTRQDPDNRHRYGGDSTKRSRHPSIHQQRTTDAAANAHGCTDAVCPAAPPHGNDAPDAPRRAARHPQQQPHTRGQPWHQARGGGGGERAAGGSGTAAPRPCPRTRRCHAGPPQGGGGPSSRGPCAPACCFPHCWDAHVAAWLHGGRHHHAVCGQFGAPGG